MADGDQGAGDAADVVLVAAEGRVTSCYTVLDASAFHLAGNAALDVADRRQVALEGAAGDERRSAADDPEEATVPVVIDVDRFLLRDPAAADGRILDHADEAAAVLAVDGDVAVHHAVLEGGILHPARDGAGEALVGLLDDLEPGHVLPELAADGDVTHGRILRVADHRAAIDIAGVDVRMLEADLPDGGAVGLGDERRRALDRGRMDRQVRNLVAVAVIGAGELRPSLADGLEIDACKTDVQGLAVVGRKVFAVPAAVRPLGKGDKVVRRGDQVGARFRPFTAAEIGLEGPLRDLDGFLDLAGGDGDGPVTELVLAEELSGSNGDCRIPVAACGRDGDPVCRGGGGPFGGRRRDNDVGGAVPSRKGDGSGRDGQADLDGLTFGDDGLLLAGEREQQGGEGRDQGESSGFHMFYSLLTVNSA